MMRYGPLAAFAAALALLVGCTSTTTGWVAFNEDGDVVKVDVTAEATLGPAVSGDLKSTTGTQLVGTATVDPGSAPVGTEHIVTGDVATDYADIVGRATVSTDAGARGVEDHEMVQDSADHGHWQVTMQSLGTEGEVRTDTFTFHLFQPDTSTVTDTAAQ